MTDKRIGIIGAMESEVEILRNRMTITGTRDTARMTFYEGTLGNTEIVLVQSGIGKVNAAVCAQILVSCFSVTHILNTGIAGSLSDDLDIGDIVVSTDAIQHDYDIMAWGYAPGQVPGMDVIAFPADEAFRKKAVEAVKSAAPDVKVFEGRVVSGDQFISSQERKDSIKAVFGGLCTEMEGAAIAQVAWLNNIPFVIIRSISDKADDEANRPFSEIEAAAAAHSSKITTAIIERL